MIKNFSLIILIFFAFNLSFALKVNVDEIKGSKKIEFINYTGQAKKSDRLEDVLAIGKQLSRNNKDNVIFRYQMKYSIIHAISKEEPEKNSADIFSILKDARVDHIKNIRRILASYLQGKYGYTAKEANTLAIFVTYYNAVYYQNLEFFTKNYKQVVLKHLSKQNAGISLLYKDWPGNTRLVIPLTDDPKKGNITSLDTTEITDKNVIDTLKKEKDKGIEERKDIVEIKEKEKDKKEKEVKEIEKDINKDKTLLKKQEEELAKKKEDLKQKEENNKNETDPIKKEDNKEQLDKENKELQKEEAENLKKKQELEKKEEKLTEKKNQLEEKKAEIKKDKEDIKKDEESLNKKPKSEQELTKKENELDIREKEIDKKEEELKEKPDKQIFKGKLYYLKVKDFTQDGHYNNELFKIDPLNKEVQKKSTVDSICGRKFDIFSEGIVVITYLGQHSGAHNLTILDGDTLEGKKIGKANIFHRSFVEIRDNFIYAIIMDEDGFRLGKFDKDLKLEAFSKEKIHEDSFISFYDNFIYINSKNKDILMLKKDDLSLVDKIKP
jgi:chemotaxis protein histidine kinase CheA